MNNFIIILLVILIILLSILIGIALFLVFKLVIKKDLTTNELRRIDVKDLYPESSSLKQSEETSKINKDSHFKIHEKNHCPNHKDNSPVGTCLICEEAFCEECLIEHESMYFCKDHFKLYAKYKWEKITDILTTADTPEASMHIYNFKRELWNLEKTPTFVLTHYKINVNDDLVETYVQLHVPLELKDSLEKRLELFEKK